MSKSAVDSDGFQIVKSKRNPKNKQTKIPQKDHNFEKQDTFIDIEKALSRIKAAADDLRISKYLEDLLKSVSTVLQSRKVVEIVCFGLGHVGECNISRYQLALLLCIQEFCEVNKVLVHDPIFYTSECDLLHKLGLEVIKENNEAHYCISDQGLSLIYFPHCPKQLTNNFLWSNWGPKLQNCILISNSFISLIENHPSRILSETVPYISKIYPFTSELTLENNFNYTDVFNDTSIHIFPKEKLENLDPEFWIKDSKPTYENTEEFITSLMIEKLNI